MMIRVPGLVRLGSDARRLLAAGGYALVAHGAVFLALEVGRPWRPDAEATEPGAATILVSLEERVSPAAPRESERGPESVPEPEFTPAPESTAERESESESEPEPGPEPEPESAPEAVHEREPTPSTAPEPVPASEPIPDPLSLPEPIPATGAPGDRIDGPPVSEPPPDAPQVHSTPDRRPQASAASPRAVPARPSPPPPGTPAIPPARYVEPQYPEAARRSAVEGVVAIRFTVNRRGRPEGIQLEQSSGSDALDREALRAVRLWRFSREYAGRESVHRIVFQLE